METVFDIVLSEIKVLIKDINVYLNKKEIHETIQLKMKYLIGIIESLGEKISKVDIGKINKNKEEVKKVNDDLDFIKFKLTNITYQVRNFAKKSTSWRRVFGVNNLKGSIEMLIDDLFKILEMRKYYYDELRIEKKDFVFVEETKQDKGLETLSDQEIMKAIVELRLRINNLKRLISVELRIKELNAVQKNRGIEIFNEEFSMLIDWSRVLKSSLELESGVPYNKQLFDSEQELAFMEGQFEIMKLNSKKEIRINLENQELMKGINSINNNLIGVSNELIKKINENETYKSIEITSKNSMI